MDLVIEYEQRELQRVARALFEARCPLDTVRELEASESGYSADLWSRMAELGWIGLDLPSAAGGSDGTICDLFALYHEMGRSLAPTPHLPVFLAAQCLMAAGARHSDIIRAVARGSVLAVLAHVEASGEYAPAAVSLTARPASAGGYHLSGTKLLVPYAADANYILVSARTGPAERDISLFLLPAGTAGVSIRPLRNIAGAALSAVTLDDVYAGPDHLVCGVNEGWAVLEPALTKAVVLRCAEIAGAGERLLELSVAYAKTRQQFGKPIGQFQAVQYLCTDMAIAVHLTSLFGRQAAWLIDQGLPHAVEAAAAKAYGSRAAAQVAHCAHEVHAGLAFMMECDVQLFSRRLKAWELDLGDAHYHDERLVKALLEHRYALPQMSEARA
jgi:3-oxocholest-4-en-26-oyl-CoA dehydrogenase beta subunit